MRNLTLPRLTSQGLELDTSTGSFGPLRSSMDVIEDASALRERMAEDGHLYLPDYVDRELVLRARESVTERLAAEGLTDPDYSADVAVAHPDSGLMFKPDLAHDNEPLHRPLYGGRMMAFCEAGGGAQPLFPLVITGALVSVIPIIVSFLFLQRYWQGGLTFGSLKD